MRGTTNFSKLNFLWNAYNVFISFSKRKETKICKKKEHNVVEVYFFKLLYKIRFYSSVSLSYIDKELRNLAISLYKENDFY